MALNPTPGYAVVKRVEKESKTQSGLILQSNSANDPSRATVVAINYADGQFVTAKQGDEIVVQHGTGQKVQHGGEDFAIISVDNILAVVS